MPSRKVIPTTLTIIVWWWFFRTFTFVLGMFIFLHCTLFTELDCSKLRLSWACVPILSFLHEDSPTYEALRMNALFQVSHTSPAGSLMFLNSSRMAFCQGKLALQPTMVCFISLLVDRAKISNYSFFRRFSIFICDKLYFVFLKYCP
jgi:hypothetical protein